MQISNKLNTADFVELQKILMEHYKPGGGFIFVMKYLVNFLYALVVFLGFYFILQRIAQVDNLIVPAIAGLIVFVLLLYYHPRILKSRLMRAIEKAYAKSDIRVERDLTLTKEGFLSRDEKEEKSYQWTDFDRYVRSANNYFLKLKNADEGFIIKGDHLTKEETMMLEEFMSGSGLAIEERNHAK